MATVLVFPSVLGVRAGISDTVDFLREAGHDVRVVDVLEGQTFDAYDEAIAHQQTIPDEHKHGFVSQSLAEVEGPYFTLGFSSGCELAEWAAAQRPDAARGVVLVGGPIPVEWIGAPWPAGVPAQTHAMSEDPFDDGPEVTADFVRDVEAAGGSVEAFTYEGTGHLFNDPSLPDEHDPRATAAFHEAMAAFVAD